MCAVSTPILVFMDVVLIYYSNENGRDTLWKTIITIKAACSHKMAHIRATCSHKMAHIRAAFIHKMAHIRARSSL
jgi:hypothetical protein